MGVLNLRVADASIMPKVMPRYAQALKRWHESDREV